MSTLEANLSLSESAISDTDGEASDADMPLWSVVVGRNSRERKGVRVPAAFPAGVSSGSSPGIPPVLATVLEEPHLDPLAIDESDDPAPKDLRIYSERDG